MPNNDKLSWLKEVIIPIFLIIVGAVATGLSTNWFGAQSKKPENDTMNIRIVNQPSNDTTIDLRPQFQIDSHIKIFGGESTGVRTIAKLPKNELKEKTSNAIENVINSGTKVRFAVLAITNGNRDDELSIVFNSWLSKYGRTSYSTLLNSFIERGYFQEMFGGNSTRVINTDAKEAADYLCLIKGKEVIEKDEDYVGLVVGEYSYEVKIIDSYTGNISDEFIRTSEKFPGVSKAATKKAAKEALATFLSHRVLLIKSP